MRGWTLLVAALAGVGLAFAVQAAPKKKKFEAPPGVTLNDCGCYQDGDACKCVRGAVCGCPNDCEPVGCEEKRQKEIEKETAEALKQDKAKGDKRGKAEGAKDDKATQGDKAAGARSADRPADKSQGAPPPPGQ